MLKLNQVEGIFVYAINWKRQLSQSNINNLDGS